MATYPTPAQVDAAIPVNGEPSRALTNEIIKGLAIPPTFAQVTNVPASLTTAQAAGTASIRAIGTTATTAAAGNHTHAAASASAPGFMTAAQNTKLNSLVPFTLASAKPEAPDSDGVQWQIFIDDIEGVLYICIAANTWRSIMLTSWGD